MQQLDTLHLKVLKAGMVWWRSQAEGGGVDKGDANIRHMSLRTGVQDNLTTTESSSSPFQPTLQVLIYWNSAHAEGRIKPTA